jgi:hypothetical protein
MKGVPSELTTTTPGAVANSGALILLAIYLGVVVWKGNAGKLWSDISGEGGFLKWFAAAWVVRVITQFKSVQPIGGAIWFLAVLAFFFQVFKGAKQ